jgi:uncharacterized protein YkwD
VVGLAIMAISLLAGCLTQQQEAVMRELNNDRRAYGLRSLPEHWQAQKKAQAWAEKLAREGTIYHSNLAAGITVGWCSLGENVGYGPSVAAIEDAYMASSGHRANILASKWNGVGVGYATRGSTVYTVQFFIQTC